MKRVTRELAATAGGGDCESLHRSARSPEVESATIERSCGGALIALFPSINVGESLTAAASDDGLRSS
jgi:hypothetical protein